MPTNRAALARANELNSFRGQRASTIRGINYFTRVPGSAAPSTASRFTQISPTSTFSNGTADFGGTDKNFHSARMPRPGRAMSLSGRKA